MKQLGLVLSAFVILFFGIYLFHWIQLQTPAIVPSAPISPLGPETFLSDDLKKSITIEGLRSGSYSGSPTVIEETLPSAPTYTKYIASYQSEGLKIYALLTVPKGKRPASGWPVIVFNHGYIPPADYKTTERYLAYTDAFSKNGYIVFKPDYRGHGNSEGTPSGAYGSNAYTIDVLNAVGSIKQYRDADQNRIGMWGHSMGGYITLRAMVVDPDIKAGVIWGGVVASQQDLLTNWHRRAPSPMPDQMATQSSWRQRFLDAFGGPDDNPAFWNSISANAYLSDISGPIQLHHAEGDEEVPVEFSQKLAEELKTANKPVELYTYPGDNHNISSHFAIAMQRSIKFFDDHVKNR